MSMIKLIPPDSQPLMDRAAQMLKVASRGLRGVDRALFVKQAGEEAAARMDKIEPRAGEVYAHLNALGATETTGPNRNGDGWKLAALRTMMPSFIKHARAYRGHNNKNPAKSYGVIKDAWVNEDMGRGELIVAYNATPEAAKRNGGLVADEELELLEKDAEMPVSMACLTDPNFPILTKLRGYVPIKDIMVGDQVLTHQGRWRKVTLLNRRKYTGELRSFSVANIPFELEVTADHLLWGLALTCTHSATVLKARAWQLFSCAESFAQHGPGWTRADKLQVGDYLFYRAPAVYDFLTEEFTSVQDAQSFVADPRYREKLPMALWRASASAVYAYFGALFDHHGWTALRSLFWPMPDMAQALLARDILAMHGVAALVTYSVNKQTSSEPLLVLRVSGRDARPFTEYSRTLADAKLPPQRSRTPNYMRPCPDGSYALRIDDIKVRYVYDCPTYNFEVAEDESYSAAGILSHNCRVPHDVCSSCENKARNRSEYCDGPPCKHGGLKRHLGQVFEDGHVLHADNREGVFFDISKVIRPADRTAYAFGKLTTKSASVGRVVGGAELAEQWSVTAPSWLENELDDSRGAQLLQKLAQLEQSFKPGPALLAFRPEVRGVELSVPQARSSEKLAHALAALAQTQCLLPLEGFLQLISGCSAEKAAEAAAEARPALATIYRDLLARPDLDELLRTRAYTATGRTSQHQLHWAQKHAAAWSLAWPQVQRRLQQATLRRLPIPVAATTKQAASPHAAALAVEYGLYTLGFLAAQSANDDLTHTLVVSNNWC